jgi:hypothetical protein
MDQGSEERQAGDLHRRIPRAARDGFPERLAKAFFAGNRLRSGRRGLSGSESRQSPKFVMVAGHADRSRPLCQADLFAATPARR